MASKARKGVAKAKTHTTSHLDLSAQLLEAIQQGKTKIVKRLLDSRVDVNCTTEESESPLLLATTLRNKDARRAITTLLLDRGCQINECDKEGRTPLMSAITSQDHDLVVTLLERGSDVTVTDHQGNTPLCCAAESGNAAIVQKILNESLRRRLNVDHKNMRGLTALLLAAQNSHLEAAKILVEKGKASLTVRDLENFMTPEDWMTETSCYSAADLSFLSPKMRHKRHRKGVRTLADYMESGDSDSSNTYEFRLDRSHHSSFKLPQLEGTSKASDSASKSMFDVTSLQSTKLPSFSFGKVVPFVHQTTRKLSVDKLPSIQNPYPASGHHLSVRKRKMSLATSNKRSEFYSEGSLEPLIPPARSRLTRQDSITKETDASLQGKRSQPLPFLKNNKIGSDQTFYN